MSLREASSASLFRRYQGATNGGLPGVLVICPSLGMARGRSYCRHRAGLDVSAPSCAAAVIKDASVAGEGHEGRETGPGGEAHAGKGARAGRAAGQRDVPSRAHCQERRGKKVPLRVWDAFQGARSHHQGEGRRSPLGSGIHESLQMRPTQQYAALGASPKG